MDRPFAEGLFALALGLFWLIKPPAFSMGKPIRWGFLLLILGMLGGLLPLTPGWHERLTVEGLELPPTLSPSPWLTLHVTLLLVTILAWVWTVWSSVPTEKERKRQAWWLLLLLLIPAALQSGALAFRWNLFGGEDGAYLFASRDQAILLLALTGVYALAMTMEAIRRRTMLGGLALLVLVFSLVGITVHPGWFGVVVFLIAGVLWLRLRLEGRGSTSFFRAVAGTLLVGLLLLSGGLKIGFAWYPAEASGIKDVLYDGLVMLRENFLLGTGAGNSTEVFSFYRALSVYGDAQAYPPSLWLFIALEGGIFALVGAALAVYGLLRHLLRLKKHHEDTRRLAATAALLVVFCGSFYVNVQGLLWLVPLGLVFLRLALPERSLKPTRLPSWLGRIVGLGFVFVGIFWLTTSRFLPMLHPATAMESAQVAIAENRLAGDSLGVEIKVNQSLRWNRLRGETWQEMATTTLWVDNDPEEAARLFAIARTLDPLSVSLPLREGEFWLEEGDRERAYEAWLEALRRDARNQHGVEAYLLEKRASSPGASQLFDRLSQHNAPLRLRYLEALSDREFTRALPVDLTRDAGLRHLPTASRRPLMTRWLTLASLEEAARTVENLPPDVPYHWYYQALAAAKKDNHAEALQALHAHLEEPALPPENADLAETTDEDLQTAVYASGRLDDTARELYRRFHQQQRWADIQTLAQRIERERGISMETLYWQANAAEKLDRDAEAWQIWQEYLRRLFAQMEGTKEAL